MSEIVVDYFDPFGVVDELIVFVGPLPDLLGRIVTHWLVRVLLATVFCAFNHGTFLAKY